MSSVRKTIDPLLNLLSLFPLHSESTKSTKPTIGSSSPTDRSDDSNSVYYSDSSDGSSGSEYSLNSTGHFVRKRKKMSNNLLGLSVDAARYSSRHKSWRRTSKAAAIATDHLPSTIKLVTWNIDFSTANPKLRHRTALTHVQHDVLGCKGGERPAPCIILLQEVLRVCYQPFQSGYL